MGTAVECCRPFFMSLRSRTAGDCRRVELLMLLLQRSSATVVPRCFIYVYKKSQSAITSRRKGTLSNLQIK